MATQDDVRRRNEFEMESLIEMNPDVFFMGRHYDLLAVRA